MTPLVVCIKVGHKYDASYVNRLAAAVARCTTRRYEFLCLTDDASGITAPTAPIETDLPGWWAKLILFKPHWALRDRRVLFFDLDTVLVGNIDCLLEYAGRFAILRDFYHADQWGSAIMSIAPGHCQEVWSQFPGTELYWGDQAWIQRCLGQADLWQDLYPHKLVSYKVHCAEGVPTEAAVVCYHGSPRPHERASLDWMKEHWSMRGTNGRGIFQHETM